MKELPLGNFAVEVKKRFIITLPILNNKQEQVSFGQRHNVVKTRHTRPRNVARNHPTWT